MKLPDIAIDPKVVFLILAFATAFSIGQAIWGGLRIFQAKRKTNRRLKAAERNGGGIAELVVELRKQRGLSADGKKRGMPWLSELILRSGLHYQPKRWALYDIGFSAIAGFGAYMLLHKPAPAAIAALVTAIAGPLVVLHFAAKRRAKALGAQLPHALEIVVRSLEAGHPVPTAVALVGREMPDPIGSEFGMAADEIAYGATLEQAVGRIADRCQHPDIDLFASTVRLQERAGGNLTGLLKTNAHTVRERLKMRLKINAASSEGRASAMILTAAPLVVMGILQLVSPSFYGDVIHERNLQIGLGCLALWLFIGNVVMRRMIDMRI